MPDIPFTIGQTTGTLSPVSGAAQDLFHIMVDSYYKGQLYNGRKDKDSPLQWMTDSKFDAEYLGDLVDKSL